MPTGRTCGRLAFGPDAAATHPGWKIRRVVPLRRHGFNANPRTIAASVVDASLRGIPQQRMLDPLAVSRSAAGSVSRRAALRPPHALPMPGVQIAAVVRGDRRARYVSVMHSSKRVLNPRFVSARTTGTANAIDPMPSRRRSKSCRSTRTRRAQTLLERTSARFFLRSSAHFALCDAKKRNRRQVVESGENRPARARDGLQARTARAAPNAGHSAAARTKHLFLRCFLRTLRSCAGSKR